MNLAVASAGAIRRSGVGGVVLAPRGVLGVQNPAVDLALGDARHRRIQGFLHGGAVGEVHAGAGFSQRN